MNFDKAELERIWNEEPIGYLKARLKRAKKEKTYIVNIQTIEHAENPKETITIVTDNRQDVAVSMAMTEYKKKYPDLKHSSWRYNVRKLS
jgi:DNA-binding LytR/AlgR family response regulator